MIELWILIGILFIAVVICDILEHITKRNMSVIRFRLYLTLLMSTVVAIIVEIIEYVIE